MGKIVGKLWEKLSESDGGSGRRVVGNVMGKVDGKVVGQ